MRIVLPWSGVIGRTRLCNLYLNTGHGTPGWTMSCGAALLPAEQNKTSNQIWALAALGSIVLMLIDGMGMIVFGLGNDGVAIGISNLWLNGGFFPHRAQGVLMSLQTVLYYALNLAPQHCKQIARRASLQTMG